MIKIFDYILDSTVELVNNELEILNSDFTNSVHVAYYELLLPLGDLADFKFAFINSIMSS